MIKQNQPADRMKRLTVQTTQPPPMFHLRDYVRDDIPRLVAILNSVFPDEPSTIEQEEHWERTYPADNPRVRHVAETDDGLMVGYGSCMRPFWSSLQDVYEVFVVVDPAWQRRGIGQTLLAGVAEDTAGRIARHSDRKRGGAAFPC